MIRLSSPAHRLLICLVLAVTTLAAGCTAPSPTAPATPTLAPLAQIALNYQTQNDLIAARAALAGLDLTDPAVAVAELAQQEAAAGRTDTARALAELAGALQATPTVEGPDATEPSPAATEAPPTETATPEPRGFELVSRERVCERKIGSALLEVYTQDSTGGQIGGFEVQVNWNGGSDRFFTGLKPDIGPGYGDFQMEPGVSYLVRLAAWPQIVADDVISEACATETTSYPGGVRLVFRQAADAP